MNIIDEQIDLNMKSNVDPLLKQEVLRVRFKSGVMHLYVSLCWKYRGN